MSDMTVLEQANSALAEAREVLKKSEENLAKSQSFNEVMVEQNRRLSFALNSLMPNHQRTDGLDLENTDLKNREVYDVIHAITVLAMANTDVIHVFTRFSAHVKEFSVHAHNASQEYSRDVHHYRLMEGNVYLEKDDALEKLLSIESQVTELIINAREEAEAKAEVEA